MIQLVAPCRGHITQRHGAKQSHNGLPHGGQDYAYYSGGQVTDEVFAAADGVVVYAGDARRLGWPNQWYYNPDFDRSDDVDQSAGNVVTIRHNQGGIRFDTTYNHLAAWSVKAGDVVTAGQRIATIGETGFSAGKHLHFELLFHPFNFGTPTFGRSDPNPYFVSGLAAMGSTTLVQEDDMAQVPQAEWDEMKRQMKSVVDNVVTDKKLSDALAELPLGVWSYQNPELGGGDAFQILRDALASTNRLTDTVSAAAAKAAAGGADEATIKASVKEAITELLIAGASK